MSDYTPLTDFSVKDSLTTGNPEKAISGADVDAEFDAISTASGTKIDKPASPTTNDILYWTGSAWAARAPDARMQEHGFIAPHDNLLIVNGSTDELTITADGVQVTDGTNFIRVAVSETLDATATGANGLESGPVTADTWYYLWALSDGSVSDVFASTGASPTLPGGHTYKGLIGFARYETADWRVFLQRNNHVAQDEQAFTSLSHAAAFTTVGTATGALPPLVTSASGFMGVSNDNANQGQDVLVSGSNNAGNIGEERCRSQVQNIIAFANFEVVLETQQTVYYRTTQGVGTTTAQVSITGYRL